MKKNHTFSYFSSNKRFRRISCLIWLFSLSILAITIVTSFTFEQSRREFYQQQYGSWQGSVYNASKSEVQSIENHPFIEDKGTLEILPKMNYILPPQWNQTNTQQLPRVTALAGVASPGFFDLSNIQVKYGRLPETETEVAAETWLLDAFHLPYDPGIQFDLVYENTEGMEEVLHCTLSGVLSNYSATWVSDGQLPSLFFGKKGSLPVVQTDVFFTALDGKTEIFEDFQFSNPVFYNAWCSFGENPLKIDLEVFKIASMIFTGLSCICLLFFLWMFCYSHKKEARVLRACGVYPSMLQKDMFKALFSGWLPAVCLGGLCVLIGCRSIKPAFDFLLLAVLELIIALAMGYFMAAEFYKEPKPDKNKKQKSKVHKLHYSAFGLAVRSLTLNPWKLVFQSLALILAGSILTVCFCLGFYEKQQLNSSDSFDFLFINSQTPADRDQNNNPVYIP